jgi:hypothetical protein
MKGLERNVSEGSSAGEDVRSLHDDCDPARFDCFLYAKGYLFGKALLDLETSTERLGDTREL